jgi:uroporphyrinogen-III synthase
MSSPGVRTQPARAVVVTRDEPADGPLSSALRGLGLAVLAWPVLRILPPEDVKPLAQALERAAQFDWMVFASQHAVQAVTERLPAPPPGVRLAAVGERTAEALRERGWPMQVVPAEASAAALVEALTPHITRGTRVLFPASSRSLPTLPAGLERLGAQVLTVEAYRTHACPLDVGTCRADIEREAVGAVTFTSPSAVEELDRALGPPYFQRLLAAASTVALGGTTARAIAAHGIEPVLAQPPTLQGLAATTFRVLQTR